LGYDPRERILSRRKSRQRLASDSGGGAAAAAGAGKPLQAPDSGGGGAGGGGGKQCSQLPSEEAAAAAKAGKHVGSATVDMLQPFACGSFKNAYLGTMNNIKICVLRHRGGAAAANAEVLSLLALLVQKRWYKSKSVFSGTDAAPQPQMPRRSVYLLYWYKSTHTDTPRAASQVEHEMHSLNCIGLLTNTEFTCFAGTNYKC
jgi:hypothetical protein